MEQKTGDIFEKITECFDELLERTSEVASELKSLLIFTFELTKGHFSESDNEDYEKLMKLLDDLIDK